MCIYLPILWQNSYTPLKMRYFSFAIFINQLDAALTQMEGRINYSLNVASTAVNTIVFPMSIPGRIAKNAFYVCASVLSNLKTIAQSPNNAAVALFSQTNAIAQLFDRENKVIKDAITSASVYFAAFAAQESFESAANSNTDTISCRDIDETVAIIRRKISEIAENDKSQNLQLQKLGLIVAESGRQALAKVGGAQRLEIKTQTNIYTVLLRGRIDRSKAWQVCLRNNIENPNRVEGVVYLPESDY